MLIRIFSLFALCSLVFAPIEVVRAQDVAAEAAATDQEPEYDGREALLKKQRELMRSQLTSAMTSLEKDDLNHFMVVYANYTIYSMVKQVRGDLSSAVKGCVENNPKMADEINARFEKWDSKIGLGMENSKANIDNLVLAQSYKPQAEFQEIFSTLDASRMGEGLDNVNKIPVTTPEACGYMLSKMDETEERMSTMLSSTMMSYPEIVRKTQE